MKQSLVIDTATTKGDSRSKPLEKNNNKEKRFPATQIVVLQDPGRRAHVDAAQ